MWSVSKCDNVAVEDLDTLQFELERTLINVVEKKWKFENELNSISKTSNVFTIFGSQDSQDSQTIRYSTSLEQQQAYGGDASNSSSTTVLVDPFITSPTFTTITPTTIATTQTITTAHAPTSTTTTPVFNILTKGPKPIAAVPKQKKSNKKSSASSTTNSINSSARPDSKYVADTANDTTASIMNNSSPLIRNELPDRFWPYVSRYCVEPTKEQLEVLEQMMMEYQDTSEFFKIPDLGPNKNVTMNDEFNRKTPRRNDGFGPLTQRLVSCLIEVSETPIVDEQSSTSEASLICNTIQQQQTNNCDGAKSNELKNLDLGSVSELEKNIRRELERHQILTQTDEIISIQNDEMFKMMNGDDDDDDDDEIVRELKFCQSELSVIQAFNEATLGRMLSQAKKRAELETARRELNTTNIEVIDIYQKLLQAKQKKRPPTKRERETAKRAVKEQETIFRRCDELASSIFID